MTTADQHEPRSRSQKRQRPEVAACRLNGEEMAYVRAAAEREGRSVSEFLRVAAVERADRALLAL